MKYALRQTRVFERELLNLATSDTKELDDSFVGEHVGGHQLLVLLVGVVLFVDAQLVLHPGVADVQGPEAAGFIFGHFFGGFSFTTPHLDNVTDDRRYSPLLEDFSSVPSWYHFNSSFSRKKGPFDFFGGLFEGLRAPYQRAKKALFPQKTNL